VGQHTFFYKRKDLYLEEQELYKKLDDFDNGEIYLEDLELNQIHYRLQILVKLNHTRFHDLFRTGKLKEDRSYIDDVISSRKECFEWIEDPKNLVSFKHVYYESDEDTKIHKQLSIQKIHEFWNEYPEGVIAFG
jgi:hypothetical protein